MSSAAFDHTKTALLALGGHRAWSLMVTLFGDLAQNEGSSIDGPVLSAMMGAMDVRPEAVRVALHRLRNDGWVASQKQGRTRRHSLTPTSRHESVQASTRIYASPHVRDTDWQLVMVEDSTTPPREEMGERGFVPLMPRLYLGSDTATPPRGALVLSGGTVPGWLPTQVAAQLLEDEYKALLPLLQSAERALVPEALDELETAVLRCLVVHNWRRIVLRHPPFPRGIMPDVWAGHQCHLLVHRLLERFARPRLNDILPT